MPKLIVSIDSVIIKEVELTGERTTVGRRPYNDVVIDNLAVSGEHAVMLLVDGSVQIEDLGSTNGTYVNGKAVKRQTLVHGDSVEIGKYKIRFQQQADEEGFDKTMVVKPGMLAPSATPARSQASAPTAPHTLAPAPPATPPKPLVAIIRVLSGSAAGREVSLQKVVTTVGKPGLAVASITKRTHGYVLAHVEGDEMPLLNGTPIGSGSQALKDGDQLELAGSRMQFEMR